MRLGLLRRPPSAVHLLVPYARWARAVAVRTFRWTRKAAQGSAANAGWTRVERLMARRDATWRYGVR